MPARSCLVPLLLCLLLPGLLTGCESESKLGLSDLTPEEHLYIQRIVQLERAKAVALMDRETGAALFDSLAAAWGDSALPETLALPPREPIRSAEVADLLMRILLAEEDSLRQAARPDRIGAPLPEPVSPPSEKADADR